MEHASHTPQTSDRPVRIPPVVWFLGLGLLAALVAIFGFNVPLGTVGYYALLVFFIGGHFFMHGSHGGPGGHTGDGPRTTNSDGPAADAKPSEGEHRGHSGGCH